VRTRQIQSGSVKEGGIYMYDKQRHEGQRMRERVGESNRKERKQEGAGERKRERTQRTIINV